MTNFLCLGGNDLVLALKFLCPKKLLISGQVRVVGNHGVDIIPRTELHCLQERRSFFPTAPTSHLYFSGPQVGHAAP